METDQEPEVAVEVDGVPWTVVEALAGHAPESRAVAVETTGGRVVVTFGDGVHGRRPPAGSRVRIAHGGPRRPIEVRLRRSPTPRSPDAALWTIIRSDEEGLELTAPGGEGAHPRAAWSPPAWVAVLALLALLLWCWLR
jgi:hypothetical protein